MTKDDYIKTKKLTDQAGANVFPNYTKIQAAKAEIISKEELESEGFLLTDSEMIVPMKTTQQNYIDSLLKIPRVKKIFDEELAKVPEDQRDGLRAELKSKEGRDGFTSDAQYRQLSESGEIVDDSKVYGSSQVPLSLDLVYPDETRVTIWQNCLCNSPLAVKPLR